MSIEDPEEFVNRFAAAWGSRESEAFEALWWPEGKLHYPFASRVISGHEIRRLNEYTKANQPNLTWAMVDWTTRGDVIVVEWMSTNRYGDMVLAWRGVDKLTLLAGRIIEEIVYADTAPLQALRRGETFEALIVFPD